MNNKLLKFVPIILPLVFLIILSACIKQGENKYFNLPDNQLNFSVEGDAITYENPYFPMDHISVYIDGQYCWEKPYLVDTIWVEEYQGWLRITRGKYVGESDNKAIIGVTPNTTGKPRSAKIRVSDSCVSAHGYLYVNQAEK